MTPWLHIVGVGEGGMAELPPSSVALIDAAEAILGPPRFLDRLTPTPDPSPQGGGGQTVPSTDSATSGLSPPSPLRGGVGGGGSSAPRLPKQPRALIPWQPPLEAMLGQIVARRGRPTVILATGDPMWFGIGATLATRFAAEEFAVVPHPSAFQLAAARMRWPLQHVTTLSLHGRPAEHLHPHLLPGNRILALTSDAGTAQHVLTMLSQRGYGHSRVTAIEAMGGPAERIHTGTAESFDAGVLGAFYILAIECVADPGTPLLPRTPGLPDEAFLNDGQLTKREVRAAALAKLAPYPGALLWDVGAGCGSIAIEWMRAARDARAIAFEREGERLQMIAVNAAALGVPNLQIENGDAPASFAGMPAPDAVFLGGGVGNEQLFAAAWAALRPGGRLVANAVTLDGEQALYRRQAELGGDLARIDIAVLDRVGGHRVMRTRMPVTQWAVQKP